jgi:hypothetical protein
MDPVPRAEAFYTDNLRQHARSPLLAAEILAADEGSLASRLSGGVRKLAGLAKRWADANFQAELTRVQRERRRRLSDEDGAKRQLSALYDELERQQKAREAARREALLATADGRRLAEDDVRRRVEAPELPAHHTFSWLHELVDWRAAADEWTRVHDLMTERHELRMEGRGMVEILQKTTTGYRLLDDPERYAFSKVGDALRRLWHRKANGTDEHFVNHTKSHLDLAAKHAPVSHGRVRRLSEGFFGAVAPAPYALFDTGTNPSIHPPPVCVHQLVADAFRLRSSHSDVRRAYARAGGEAVEGQHRRRAAALADLRHCRVLRRQAPAQPRDVRAGLEQAAGRGQRWRDAQGAASAGRAHLLPR